MLKREVDGRFKYVMLYDDTYYKVGLIDLTYGIINDGKEAFVYRPYGERKPLTIQTSIGLGVIMPVYFHDKNTVDNHIVIKVK